MIQNPAHAEVHAQVYALACVALHAQACVMICVMDALGNALPDVTHIAPVV